MQQTKFTANRPQGETSLKPEGGYVQISTLTIGLLWWAYTNELLSLRALRVGLALYELRIRRCAYLWTERKRGNTPEFTPNYSAKELAAFCGLPTKRATAALAELLRPRVSRRVLARALRLRHLPRRPRPLRPSASRVPLLARQAHQATQGPGAPADPDTPLRVGLTGSHCGHPRGVSEMHLAQARYRGSPTPAGFLPWLARRFSAFACGPSSRLNSSS